MNAFLRSQRVLHVDRRWVENGEHSYWAMCIDYVDRPSLGSASGPLSTDRRTTQIDYREVLSAEEFGRFSQLRTLRKELAAENAVPVYSVMTNEQIARIVQDQIQDRQGLLKIPGLGESKVERYGARILALIGAMKDSTNETGKSAV